MLFANVNNKKTEAIPKTSGICPLCGRDVFSKCGEVNVWHWAHNKDKSCDNWYEPETEWHKNWKLIFGIDNCERIIHKEKTRHIADILTTNNIVIELQNSTIQKPIIRKRENFYGEQMIWIINGKDFKDNFTTSSDSTYSESISADLEYYRNNNPLLSESDKSKIIIPSQNELNFSWIWARKTWSDVQRNVFIDFGDKDLFWVKSGMGTSKGKGEKIKKEAFLRKHGGNVDMLDTIINKETTTA